ncbi:MAG: hypothetical protein J0I52_03395 [Bordetella sp.]|nr:hypothetical protein [Bordetella sp.]
MDISGRRGGRLPVLAGLALLAAWAPAQARQATGPDIAVTAAVSSDFVSRGISMSEGDPAVSIGADVSQGVFYVGAWAGNASFAGDPDTKAEVDLYLGVRPSFGGFDWDFSLAHYAFPGQPSGADYDFSEVRARATRQWGAVTMGALIYWSADFFGAEDKEATYMELSGAIQPAERWTVSTAIARQEVSSDADYNTWNLGTTWAMTPKLALDVRYYDTDAHRLGDIYDRRVVASLAAAF